MDPVPAPVPLEALLAHREWVRRVALALVGDENMADDLEQDLWVRTLERPPVVRGSVRGWIAASLRNGFIDRFRSETARRRREAASARPEPTRSTGDLVAVADSHRRVVVAVMDLEEPYRSTVLLRYFEGLPPGRIAQRLGAPVETIRTRLKRAIRSLRRRFAEEDGQDGTPWLCVLLSRTRPGSDGPAWTGRAVPPTGGGLMASKTVAAAVAAVVVIGLAWLASGPDTRAPGPDPGPPTETAVAAVPAVREVPTLPAPEPVPAPEPEPAPVPELLALPEPLANATEPPNPEPPEGPVAFPLFVLTGTVRSMDGLPVDGARVFPDPDSWALRGQDGMPMGKEVVERIRPSVKAAVTDGEGRFTIEVRVPHGIAIPIRIAAEGFLGIERGVLAIEENLSRAHDFVLERAVGIEGRVVDQEGAPVSGASVFLWEAANGPQPATTRTGSDGRFALPGVAAGAWTLDVQGGWLPEGTRWKSRTHRRIVHGGDRDIEIALEHSPLAGARVLLDVVDGLTGDAVEPVESSINPVEGEPLEWTGRNSALRSSKGSLRIETVEPGRWIAWAKLADGRVGWGAFEVSGSDTEVRGRVEIGGTGSIGGRIHLGGLTLARGDSLQVSASSNWSRTFPQFANAGDGSGGEVSGHGWANADGSFVIRGFVSDRGLLPGVYELRAWARGITALGTAEVRANRRTLVELTAVRAGILRFRLSGAMPPCRLGVELHRPGSAWPVTGIQVEKREETEWTEDVQIHPGTYSWKARFGNPAHRHSLLEAALPAAGTVTVGPGETVEVVIPVVRESR